MSRTKCSNCGRKCEPPYYTCEPCDKIRREEFDKECEIEERERWRMWREIYGDEND